jgi:hypothetical protein
MFMRHGSRLLWNRLSPFHFHISRVNCSFRLAYCCIIQGTSWIQSSYSPWKFITMFMRHCYWIPFGTGSIQSTSLSRKLTSVFGLACYWSIQGSLALKVHYVVHKCCVFDWLRTQLNLAHTLLHIASLRFNLVIALILPYKLRFLI